MVEIIILLLTVVGAFALGWFAGYKYFQRKGVALLQAKVINGQNALMKEVAKITKLGESLLKLKEFQDPEARKQMENGVEKGKNILKEDPQ